MDFPNGSAVGRKGRDSEVQRPVRSRGFALDNPQGRRGTYTASMKDTLILQNRVKELRSRLKIRQVDLAKDAEVTRQTVIAIEKGQLNPSITVCLKIARVLREPVDYVFYLEREAPPAEPPKPRRTRKPKPKPSPEPDTPQAVFDFG